MYCLPSAGVEVKGAEARENSAPTALPPGRLFPFRVRRKFSSGELLGYLPRVLINWYAWCNPLRAGKYIFAAL